jgi:hypothetical protein
MTTSVHDSSVHKTCDLFGMVTYDRRIISAYNLRLEARNVQYLAYTLHRAADTLPSGIYNRNIMMGFEKLDLR